MSKLFKIMGAVFLTLLIAIGVSAAVLVPKISFLNKDAKTWIGDNLPAIVATWNPDYLTQRAAPELLKPKVKDQLPRLFVWFASLGKLEKIGDPTGGVSANFFSGGAGLDFLARYTVPLEFAAGPAQITLALKRVGGSWQVTGFYLNSPALVPSSQ